MRCGMNQIPYCDLCGSAVEFAIYAIRDCRFAKTIWKSIVSKRGWRDFLNSALEVGCCGTSRMKSMRTKGWQLLASSWVKINVDGLVSMNRLKATIARVMRGPSEGWLVGFRMITGMLDIFNIEAKAILEGLKLAWDKGFRKVEVEKVITHY
ncbi:hypothetical protein GOBAR_AA13185 [Gossypium barbadense]|uniref:RNase H type-1 domain-containing protein n=1 Tax=Gossypium barbadense TaxID=3634 RepID=A0A2P5XVV6_GOSBA|nr:hypothetical protein GOBAR_AA13185 [Gossypium barbadense]